MKRFLTKTRLVVIAGLVGVVGLVALNLPAAATTEQTHDFPFFPDSENRCTGEFVIWPIGEGHLTFFVTDNGNGTFQVRSHLNVATIRGTGLSSGDRYQYEEVDSSATYILPNGTTETTEYHKVVLQHHAGVIPESDTDDRFEHIRVTTRWQNGVPAPGMSNQVECR